MTGDFGAEVIKAEHPRKPDWAGLPHGADTDEILTGLVPRQATFARQGAASGACSRRAGRKPSYWTHLGFRPVRRECVPGVATGRTLPVAALGLSGPEIAALRAEDVL